MNPFNLPTPTDDKGKPLYLFPATDADVRRCTGMQIDDAYRWAQQLSGTSTANLTNSAVIDVICRREGKPSMMSAMWDTPTKIRKEMEQRNS